MIVAVLNAVKNEQLPEEEWSDSVVTGVVNAFFVSFTKAIRLVSPSLVRASLAPPRPCANLRSATTRHMYMILSHHCLCVFYIIFYKGNRVNTNSHKCLKNHLCKILYIKFKTFYCTTNTSSFSNHATASPFKYFSSNPLILLEGIYNSIGSPRLILLLNSH